VGEEAADHKTDGRLFREVGYPRLVSRGDPLRDLGRVRGVPKPLARHVRCLEPPPVGAQREATKTAAHRARVCAVATPATHTAALGRHGAPLQRAASAAMRAWTTAMRIRRSVISHPFAARLARSRSRCSLAAGSKVRSCTCFLSPRPCLRPRAVGFLGAPRQPAIRTGETLARARRTLPGQPRRPAPRCGRG